MIRALIEDPRLTRSEKERASTRLIKQAQLPKPLTNVPVHGYKADVYWPQQGLVVEFDGWQAHGHRLAFESNRKRDQILIANGLRVLRVTDRQLDKRADRAGRANRAGTQVEHTSPPPLPCFPDGMQYWDALFAFLVAMAVAAALTPLAARLARRVGAVVMPSERGLAERRHPRPRRRGDPRRRAGRGRAVAAGDDPPAPHARHRARLGGTVHTWAIIAGACLITLVGAIDDAHPLTPAVEAARPDRGGADRGRGRSDRHRRHDPVPRHAPAAEHRRSADRDLAGRDDERRQPVGRGRRAGRGAVRDRRDRVRDHRVRPAHRRRRRARGADRRRRARLPVPQLPAGFVVHGRLGREPARLPARGGRGHRLGEDRRGRRPDRAADRARGAVPRHRASSSPSG